jgi:hypothetical protein
MNEHSYDPGMEHVERALAALREASAGTGAPEHLEAGLRDAFRAHHQRPALVKPVRTRRYAWIAGALAASIAIVAAIGLSHSPVVTAPEPPVVAKAAAPLPPQPTVADIRSAVRNEPKSAKHRAVRAKPRQRPDAPPVSAAAPRRREVMTDFFAIPYAPAMTQADYGQVIRVNVPATSMRTFGLPVSEDRMFDRVQADVLMGEDGIARAIRFVRQQNLGLNYR